MKRDTHTGGRYTRLKWRIFFYLVGLAVCSVVLFFVAYNLAAGHIAITVVRLMQRLFNLPYETALLAYNVVFRYNGEFFLFVLIVLVFLLLTRLTLQWFVRYFQQIDAALDGLLADDGRVIRLPPEIYELERKLHSVQETLRRRALQGQLAEQRKDDLVVYLAHDLRTPLTSVIGYLSLLDEAPDMPAEQRARYVGITLRKARRLESLINEFFEITRYDLQEIILEKQPLDLAYMLAQLTDEFWPQLHDHGNTLQLEAAPGLSVIADPDKLARVFNNLMKNAIAYSWRDTPIKVQAHQQAQQVVIRFENQGATIPPHRLESIFEKFFRLDAARSSDAGGAGLGLAIAREIVERHGGQLTATSENNVTAFTVTLPAD